MFELPLGFIERPSGRTIGVFCAEVVGWGIRDDKLMPRQTNVDRQLIAVSVTMMVAGQFDDDVTRDDTVKKKLELFDALLDVVRECVRPRHAPECDLQWGLHEVLPRSSLTQDSCDRRE
jgi:hypothetical protein